MQSRTSRRIYLKNGTQSLLLLLILTLSSISAVVVSAGSTTNLPGSPGTCWTQKFKDNRCTEPLGVPSFTLFTITQSWQEPIQMSANCTARTPSSFYSLFSQLWTQTYSDGQRMYLIEYANEGCNQTDMITSVISEPLNTCLETASSSDTSGFLCPSRIACGKLPFSNLDDRCNTVTPGTYSMIVCDTSSGDIKPSPITWPPLQLPYDYMLQYICSDTWCQSGCRPQRVMPLNGDFEMEKMQREMNQPSILPNICPDQRKMCYGSDGGMLTVSRTVVSEKGWTFGDLDQGWCNPNATVVRVDAVRATCDLGRYYACPDLNVVPQHVALPVEVQNLGWRPAIVQESIGKQCWWVRGTQLCESGSMIDSMIITFPGVCQPGAGASRREGSRIDTCSEAGMTTTFYKDNNCQEIDTVHDPITFSPSDCNPVNANAENSFAIYQPGAAVRSGCNFLLSSDGRLFPEQYGDASQFDNGGAYSWNGYSGSSGSKPTTVRNVLVTVGILVFLFFLAAIRAWWRNPICQRFFGLCQCSWWPFRLRDSPVQAQVRPSAREFVLLDMLPSPRSGPRIVNGVLAPPNRS